MSKFIFCINLLILFVIAFSQLYHFVLSDLSNKYKL